VVGNGFGGFVDLGLRTIFKEGFCREEKCFDLGMKRGKKKHKSNFFTICEPCTLPVL